MQREAKLPLPSLVIVAASECHVTSFIKGFLRGLGTGNLCKLRYFCPDVLHMDRMCCRMGTSLVGEGMEAIIQPPASPQCCLQRRNLPWRNMSLWRWSTAVKFDYREQLSVSDKIINLTFVYFVYSLFPQYNHPTLLSSWWCG